MHYGSNGGSSTPLHTSVLRVSSFQGITPTPPQQSAGASQQATFAVLAECVSRCSSFCVLFHTYIQRDLDAFRRRLNLMTQAKSSSLLTVEEVLALTRRAVILDSIVSPGRVGEYVLAASVVAFSGGGGGSTTGTDGSDSGCDIPSSSCAAWTSECGAIVELERVVISCIASCLSISLPSFCANNIVLAATSTGPLASNVPDCVVLTRASANTSPIKQQPSNALQAAPAAAPLPSSMSPTPQDGQNSGMDTPVFFRFLNDDCHRVERYRLPQTNAATQLQVAAHFTSCVWEDHPSAWPVLIDPHRIVESMWIKTLPRAVVVVFDEGTVSAMFDAYSAADVLLVLTGVPTGSISENALKRFAERSSTPQHEGFRLLLICTDCSLADTSAPPGWCAGGYASSFLVLHVPLLDPQTAAQMALEEVHRMAWPADAQRIDECQGALLSRKSRQVESEDELWEAAIDPTPSAEARIGKARGQLNKTIESVAEAQYSLDALRRQRAEFRIVAEVSSRLYFVWYRATLRQNFRFGRVGGSRHPSPAVVSHTPADNLCYPTFLDAVVFPAVWEHLTEGSKHFTKCKTEAAQEMVAWCGRLCERQLLENQRKQQQNTASSDTTSSESHSSVSIALHVIRWFVLCLDDTKAVGGSSSSGGGAGTCEQYRRLVCLWDASQNNGTGSSNGRQGGKGNNGSASSIRLCRLTFGEVVIPRAMADFASSVFPPVVDTENDVFARLQRLLLTLSSIRTLLLLDSFSDSVEEFAEWCGHVQTTRLRLPSVEFEVLGALVKGVQLLADPPRAADLVDALSLFAALREMNGSMKAVTTALLVDVPRRQAGGLVRVLPQHLKDCMEVEREARELLSEVVVAAKCPHQEEGKSTKDVTRIAGEDAEGEQCFVNPNKVLEVRNRVAELRETRKRLLRTDPTGRGGSGLPVMGSVEKLVAVCLPST